MKNLTRPIAETEPTPLTPGDGIIYEATRTLKAVRYPNRLEDIAVMGKKRDWQRSFLLRPKYGGKFLFLLYPKGEITPQSVLMRELSFVSFNSPPEVLDMTIPPGMRDFYEWEWRVVKLGAVADEEEYEASDMDESSDGLMTPLEGMELVKRAKEELSLSTLIYDTRSVLSGEISFEEERRSTGAKMVLWSCHQPYESKEGKGAVKEATPAILSYYKEILDKFSPHMVCMLGDSVYSDGTGALNFVSQVYSQSGWNTLPSLRDDLLSLYRLNYRYHWGFDTLRSVMGRYPHMGMWDDHEIRDGYGSDEKDFSDINRTIKEIASKAAQEYLFSFSPKLRSESSSDITVDNHQVYTNRSIAFFAFDGRNSREYGEDLPLPIVDMSIVATVLFGLIPTAMRVPVVGLENASIYMKLTQEIADLYRRHNPGQIISDAQLRDFEKFCNTLKSAPEVKYLLMGNSVPFIYILDFVETIAAEAAITATEIGREMRDDIRDSWHSPANRVQLAKLIDILRDLHHAREDIEIINLSGDIHISNAFTFQPHGFRKPLFQITSSAFTNDPPGEEMLMSIITADGPLDAGTESEDFGRIKRLWHEGKKQNFLTIEADAEKIVLSLHVYDSDDKRLTIVPGQGYTLRE